MAPRVGCIPSKAMLHAAAVMDEVSHFVALGVSFGKSVVNVEKLRGHKEKVVEASQPARAHPMRDAIGWSLQCMGLPRDTSFFLTRRPMSPWLDNRMWVE